MLKTILFYVVILITNVIQGITGFAGTILAMTPSIMLVGYEQAKPILNALGLLAGLIIMFGGLRDVQWKELRRIIPVMLAGIVFGSLMKPFLAANMKVMYIIFGVFILILAIKGLFLQNLNLISGKHKVLDYILLVLAGLIHGLFVSGGPLLIEYTSRRIRDRQQFRRTISSVWVVLNTIILCDDLRAGYWDLHLLKLFLCSVPFFLVGIGLGSFLCRKMNRSFFMILTYLLMGVSGVMILLK